LIRLYTHTHTTFDENQMLMLATINEIYIDARYPGDMGLMPQGKPTLEEIDKLISFCEQTINQLKSKL